MAGTVGAVRKAIGQLWQDTLGDDVQVQLGPRRDDGDDRVRIGDATGTSEPVALGPRRTMQEDYEITCVISCTRNATRDDQDLATDRVLELYDAADTALRAVPGQAAGVAGVIWAYVAGNWSLTEPPASQTLGPVNAYLEFRVRVRARYQLT